MSSLNPNENELLTSSLFRFGSGSIIPPAARFSDVVGNNNEHRRLLASNTFELQPQEVIHIIYRSIDMFLCALKLRWWNLNLKIVLYCVHFRLTSGSLPVCIQFTSGSLGPHRWSYEVSHNSLFQKKN